MDEVDPAGKRVLLRVDFNVPLSPDGEIRDESRLVAALPTIRELLARGAALIIATHLGRPHGKPDPALSTRQLVPALERELGISVGWVADCVGPEVEARAKALLPGQVLLLENLRFHQGEEANDPDFAQQLAALADLYVDDAFGAAHRAHASTEGVAHLLPAVAGRLMAREVSELSRILDDPSRPLLAVIGGSKLSTKLGLLESLIERVDTLCLGGAMAATFLKAADREVGRSLVEDEFLDRASAIVRRAAEAHVDLELPVDVVVAVSPEADAALVEVRRAEEVPADQMILDIGPETVQRWADLISKAGTIVWNGPVGLYEREPFARGTSELARAIAFSSAESVTGGGDLQAALASLGLTAGFTHVSTGGGATLEFLEGRELPGLVALQDAPEAGRLVP
ncbi:MAG TPA: phosphoglycerate kinase [Candidatus Dormibacteraeota bacterium]